MSDFCATNVSERTSKRSSPPFISTRIAAKYLGEFSPNYHLCGAPRPFQFEQNANSADVEFTDERGISTRAAWKSAEDALDGDPSS